MKGLSREEFETYVTKFKADIEATIIITDVNAKIREKTRAHETLLINGDLFYDDVESLDTIDGYVHVPIHVGKRIKDGLLNALPKEYSPDIIVWNQSF